MTLRFFTLYTLLCGVLFLTSCKKEKQQQQQEDNNTDLLTRSSWVVTKEEYDNGGGTWKAFSENEMVYKKLTFNFKVGGTMRIVNNSGTTWDGEWKFINNGTTIWTKDKLLPEWKIVRLTKTELQIIQPAGHAGEPDERCTFVHP